MYVLIISLIILLAILLVLVILAQNSKGGGLSSQFGGSTASNIMGVKKTGDLLERLTWGFAIGIIVLALASSKFTNQSSSTEDDILKRAKEQQQVSPSLPIKKSAAPDSVKK